MRRYEHPAAITSLAFCPNRNALLAIGSEDASWRLWNVEQDAPPKKLPGHEAVVSGLSFSPDGRRLASCSAGKIQLWDLDADIRILELAGPDSNETLINLSDACLAATTNRGDVWIWDSPSGARPVSTQQPVAP